MRLEVAEKQAFEAAADLAGLALSAWVRERLRKVAAHELEEAGRGVAFLSSVEQSSELEDEKKRTPP